jgi:peptide/nickel transport system substrate-binding protein
MTKDNGSDGGKFIHPERLVIPGEADRSGSGLTRRQLMTYGGQGLALLGAGSLLAACGSTSGSSTGGTATGATSLAGGKPVRGGKLIVGAITGGASETLNPGAAGLWCDMLRINQLYDYLFLPGPGNEFNVLEPRLATAAEPNKDATVWTLKLRDGVSWHDGKPFTADDVLWTLGSWSKSSNYGHAFVVAFIDFKRVRKIDKLTVEIPLIRPSAEFPTLLSNINACVIQNGATPATLGKNPVGTGPFKFVSFKPGSQSVFVRNPDYWEGNGKPYIDELVINSSFQEENSRYNALLGGEIDVSIAFPANYARQQQSSQQVNLISSPSGQAYSITMRITNKPFTDQRVVEAMKLLTDRQALIDGVLPGYAQAGNDLVGRFAPYFANDLKAEYDVEKAKSLLKAAGQENMQVTLQTSNASPGFVESATLFSQQAAAAGVKVNVEQLSPAIYFTEAGGYGSRTLGQGNPSSYPSMTTVAAGYFLPGAAYEVSGWTKQPGGGDQKLLSQAIAQQDPTKAKELWHEFQTELFKKDGHLIWAYFDFIDAAQKNVEGLSAGIANPLNNFRVLDAWLTS